MISEFGFLQEAALIILGPGVQWVATFALAFSIAASLNVFGLRLLNRWLSER